MIVLAAAILGFTYTGLTGKGLFKSPLTAATSTFLTYEEALDLFRGGNALFVDARHPYDFARGHIPGAVNVPQSDVQGAQSLLAIIPRNALLVTYCDGAECNSSVQLALTLSEAGYTNVKVFFGGWNAWTAHHQPVDP